MVPSDSSPTLQQTPQGFGDDYGQSSSNPTPQRSPRNVLLIVFIHGFKGNDTTFGNFPSRLQHILSETIQDTLIESIVFPAYDTKGDLDKAVELFADWLTTLTVQKEVAHGGGAGCAKIVLCGHSMGGLLATDSTHAFINTRPDASAPLWPNIIACIAFDTPYLGLHPHVFKHSANQLAEYVQNMQKGTSGLWGAFSQPVRKPAATVVQPKGLLPAPAPTPGRWGSWTPTAYAIGGALIAGAAAGTAYYHRDELESSYGSLMEHMQYVGALWDKDALAERVRRLVKGEKMHGIIFRIFYALLPPSPPSHPSRRTFCFLPGSTEDSLQHFLPARNSLAENEVRAHVSMFEPERNDGYYQLGLEVAAVIRQALLAEMRAAIHNKVEESGIENQVEGGHIAGEQQATGEDSDLLL